MSHTVTLNDDQLLNAAKGRSRPLDGQIEYWAQLGKFVEESGIVNLAKVDQALKGVIPVSELTGEEQKVHTWLLWDALEGLDGSDRRVFERIKKAGGRAYGINQDGDIEEMDDQGFY